MASPQPPFFSPPPKALRCAGDLFTKKNTRTRTGDEPLTYGYCAPETSNSPESCTSPLNLFVAFDVQLCVGIFQTHLLPSLLQWFPNLRSKVAMKRGLTLSRLTPWVKFSLSGIPTCKSAILWVAAFIFFPSIFGRKCMGRQCCPRKNSGLPSEC
eukprot:RCo029783